MKKSLILIVLVFLVCTVAFCQQDPLYAQYINNPFVINPAYAGFTKDLNVNMSYRHQWTGLEGSPKTVNLNGHVSLFDNRMATGVMFVSDKIGNSTTTEFMATYAYRIKIDNNKVLSFGLQAGAINYKIDNSKVNPYDPGDPLFDGAASKLNPTLGAGIILSSHTFYVGFSVPRMLNANVHEADMSVAVYSQHYYVMGSYLFFVADRVRFKPSALVKLTEHSPASVDVNASFILFENYQAGLVTRNFNTYGIMLQAMVRNSFRVGYVFEVPTGNSVGSNFTTHEITIGFRTAILTFHESNSVMSF